MDTDEEWIDDDDLTPEIRAKIFALKTCRNRCLAHASDENALDIAKPVLKMFITLVVNGGSFTDDANDEYVWFSSLSYVLYSVCYILTMV